MSTHERAVRRSNRDALTGLANHRAYHEDMVREVAIAREGNRPLTLALIDLDNFKLVNDRSGHRRGDVVLTEIGRLLQGGRPADRPYRVGGDEFALLLSFTDPEEARATAERLRAQVEAQLAPVTLSIGIAHLAADVPDAEALRESADAALYEAKHRGRNSVVVFPDVHPERMVVSPSKSAALRRLLESGEVGAAFQPIVRLDGGGVMGFEALARPDAALGLDGPAEAFVIAERLGRSPSSTRCACGPSSGRSAPCRSTRCCFSTSRRCRSGTAC